MIDRGSPCGDCSRRESCRLPLNCERYLRFCREREQHAQDREALRRCQLGGGDAVDELRNKAVMRRYRALAKAVPWRQEGVQHG